jgi:predicted MPP superfamily phosphohydrolase
MSINNIPWIDVSTLELTLPRLDEAFDGFRLVQISDIHFGTYINRTRLDQAVRLANQLAPDAVAITGDFVSRSPRRFAQDLSASLSLLEAPEGVFAVLGNHDHWTDARAVEEILKSSGIENLNNKVHRVFRADRVLNLAGVDCTYVHQDRLDRVLSALPAEGAAILLAHEPDYADVSASTGRFDLQISGHSHGGQLILPRIGPPVLPPLAKKYPLGRYQINGMIQYTNRGLGTSHFRLRINCPAEITLLTLRSGMR